MSTKRKQRRQSEELKSYPDQMQKNIQVLIVANFRQLWTSEIREEIKTLVAEEMSSTKQEITTLRQEVDQLATRTDMLSGSAAFIADQYRYDSYTTNFSAASKIAKQNLDNLLKVKLTT